MAIKKNELYSLVWASCDELREGVFPDYRAKTADINEERNSAFVAVTRAKRWLYISYPTQRTMPWGGVKGQARSQFYY